MPTPYAAGIATNPTVGARPWAVTNRAMKLATEAAVGIIVFLVA